MKVGVVVIDKYSALRQAIFKTDVEVHSAVLQRHKGNLLPDAPLALKTSMGNAVAEGPAAQADSNPLLARAKSELQDLQEDPTWLFKLIEFHRDVMLPASQSPVKFRAYHNKLVQDVLARIGTSQRQLPLEQVLVRSTFNFYE